MRKTLLLAALAACAAWPARAATDIRLWHAMSGEQRSEFERLAARFNASQSEWRGVLLPQANPRPTPAPARPPPPPPPTRPNGQPGPPAPPPRKRAGGLRVVLVAAAR